MNTPANGNARAQRTRLPSDLDLGLNAGAGSAEKLSIFGWLFVRSSDSLGELRLRRLSPQSPLGWALCHSDKTHGTVRGTHTRPVSLDVCLVVGAAFGAAFGHVVVGCCSIDCSGRS